MDNTRARYVAPTTGETAFNCPHCGALAKQFWHSAYVCELPKDQVPTIMKWTEQEEQFASQIEDETGRDWFRAWATKKASGVAFIDMEPQYINSKLRLENVTISKCFNCNSVGLWLYDRLIWPEPGDGPPPHPDLPEDLLPDYIEASAILKRSPRGAAALLRLVIQKLCARIAGTGKGLNDDIAALAKRDLAPTIVQALDAVRVIGNNAVHPLEMDLRDDRAAAETLFGLVNVIVDNLISRPKQIEKIYRRLPPGALEAIEKRDGKAAVPEPPKDRS
ncbi:DUF4145 domain-containing protein [Dongia deserti]|uniref:DUF4145 domain-containing protein n=1 Tax=Dongia deserti TaxID=2268030 RepID=UPI0013C46CF9|nr:DUF4145 domain-containing protein [Dongia deserti]